MPKLSALLPWLDAHGVAIVGVLTALVAAWKSVPAPARARIELAFPRVAGFARSIAAVAPDLIGFARVVWYQVLAGKARTSVLPTPVPFAPPRAVDPDAGPTSRQRRAGFAAPGALLAVTLAVFVVGAASALAGCPQYVRPACATPGAYECRADQPHVCSPSGALTPIGDVTCGRTGGVCTLDTDGLAFCAPIDGGAR